MELVLGLPLQYLIFAIALIIIAEHSFFLWDREPSEGCVAAAVDLYTKSANCSAVIKGVNDAFKDNSGHIFQHKILGWRKVTKSFEQILVQIALDNRMSMSTPS